jgi:GTPase involved in cell partitioning and DNA repair
MRSGPGEARTNLLLHMISVRPSKQPLMVRTFLTVSMELGSYFLFLQEQIKDIIIQSTNISSCCGGDGE